MGHTSHHCYQGLVVKIAAASVENADATLYKIPNQDNGWKSSMWQGEYSVSVTHIGIHQKVVTKWTASRKKNKQCNLDKDISGFISAHLINLGWEDDYKYHAYTEMVHWADGRYEQFRFCKSYKGKIVARHVYCQLLE